MNIPHAQVEALLREAAEQIVMPLWRNLGQDDVTEKSEGDITTSADTRCEAYLASHLPGFIDGSLVLGEESVHVDPGQLSALQTDVPVWVIDPTSMPLDRVRGAPMTWYLPDYLRPTAEAAVDSYQYIERIRCSGHNYPSFARNELQFLFFYRTLVWDHAPGVLIAQEAGGCVSRLDGTEYSPVDGRKGLLCATNWQMWALIQRTLVPSIPVVVAVP